MIQPTRASCDSIEPLGNHAVDRLSKPSVALRHSPDVMADEGDRDPIPTVRPVGMVIQGFGKSSDSGHERPCRREIVEVEFPVESPFILCPFGESHIAILSGRVERLLGD